MSVIKILTHYETDLLKSKLRSFPSVVKEQKAKVRQLRERYNEAEQVRAMIEADLMTDISAEVNHDTGKPMFSNDKARQAELMKRKGIDDDYHCAAKDVKEAEYVLNEAQDELDKLVDEFKSYRYIVSLTTQELALMASEEREEEYSASGQTAGSKEPY